MKAAFHTLGCKVNSYETQAISEQFLALGFDIVDYDQPADVYVVNTCSVTKEAARKSRQILNRAKKKNPFALTVATGCYAQEDAARFAGADLVIGNNEKSRIAELVLKNLNRQGEQDPQILVDDLTHCRRYEEQEISNQGDHVRAYVKIQDGCNRFCSYCIIPYLRGRSRSRAEEDILQEVKRLADAGYKEVVLTGIDISDFRLQVAAEDASFSDPEESLLRILTKIDGIEGIRRIRLGSLEEGIVSEFFVKALTGIKSLCPQFHLSLQSGSDTVLKRMNRKYTTGQFANVVDLLRRYFENPAITTDIIVGFPGETEEEFEETLHFVEEIGFASAHVFKYSRRAGTVADRMKEQLTEKEKAERSERLIAVSKKSAEEYRRTFVGKTREVLIEERVEIDGEPFQIGFTPEYIKVKIKKDEDLLNRIVPVCLSEEHFLAESEGPGES